MYHLIGEDYLDFDFFARQLGESIIWPEKPKEVVEILESDARYDKVQRYFERLIDLSYRLRQTLPSNMYNEIERYLVKIKLYGESGLDMLEVIKGDDEFYAYDKVIEALELWRKAYNMMEILEQSLSMKRFIGGHMLRRIFLTKYCIGY